MALAWLKSVLGKTIPASAANTGAAFSIGGKVPAKFRPTFDRLEDRLVPTTAVADLNTVTPLGLVQNLIGNNPGISVSNVRYTGDLRAAGTFTNGANSVGITSGVVLTSGRVLGATGVSGPNGTPTEANNNLQPGDADLNIIATPNPTTDAAVLEFDFVTTQNTLTLTYVFGSEDYNTNIVAGSDVFGIFLNGQNVAFVPGTTTPVNASTVNGAANTQFFVDNTAGSRNTEMNGFTTVQTVTLVVAPGQINRLKLAIADTNSSASLDSWVLFGSGSLINRDIGTHRPLRYVYNASTNTYDGNITVINRSASDLTGPLYIVVRNLPSGVTVANPNGFTASGAPYFVVPTRVSNLFVQEPIRLPIKLRNPLNSYLSSFFLDYSLDVTTNLA